MNNNLLLKIDSYFIHLTSDNQREIITELATELYNNKKISNLDMFITDIIKREEIASTFVENNTSIPHVKADYIKEFSVCIGISPTLITNNDPENPLKADIFILIASPKNDHNNQHVTLLSQLARLIIDENFCNKLRNITNHKELKQLINNHINHEKNNHNNSNHTNNKINYSYDIVAITACPLGIAHTYLAAQSLEKAANKHNYKIKIQTNGSSGVHNQLTHHDIKNAKLLIVASDVVIEDNLLQHPNLIKVSTSYVIRHAEQLILKSYQNSEHNNEQKTNLNAWIYKHLMNGISQMIPFAVIGGILLSLSFSMGNPYFIHYLKPLLSQELLNVFLSIGKIAFALMVPILAAFIGYSIGGKSALAPSMICGVYANMIHAGVLGGIFAGFAGGYIVHYIICHLPKNNSILSAITSILLPIVTMIILIILMFFIGRYLGMAMDFVIEILKNVKSAQILLSTLLGAMIAIDMGGPINKIAFLFATSMIASGLPIIMGSVSTAISIPPLAIYFSTILNHQQYKLSEINNGKNALVMSLIGVTEGALPFAIANPLVILPSIVIGSSIGASLATLLNVASYAPYGGIVIIPLVNNKLYFIASIIIGAMISAFLINMLNKLKSIKTTKS